MRYQVVKCKKWGIDDWQRGGAFRAAFVIPGLDPESLTVLDSIPLSHRLFTITKNDIGPVYIPTRCRNACKYWRGSIF